MSYVQGTVVIVTASVADPDSGQLEDPPDFTAAITDPDGNTTHLGWQAGQISKLDTGRFRFFIDTTPASGTWAYELKATGPTAVVKRRHLRVL